jgi:hypothetical protein
MDQREYEERNNVPKKLFTQSCAKVHQRLNEQVLIPNNRFTVKDILGPLDLYKKDDFIYSVKYASLCYKHLNMLVTHDLIKKERKNEDKKTIGYYFSGAQTEALGDTAALKRFQETDSGVKAMVEQQIFEKVHVADPGSKFMLKTLVITLEIPFNKHPDRAAKIDREARKAIERLVRANQLRPLVHGSRIYLYERTSNEGPQLRPTVQDLGQ